MDSFHMRQAGIGHAGQRAQVKERGGLCRRLPTIMSGSPTKMGMRAVDYNARRARLDRLCCFVRWEGGEGIGLVEAPMGDGSGFRGSQGVGR